MTKREYSFVEGNERTGIHPTLNHLLRDTEIEQLTPCHHPMLLFRKSSNRVSSANSLKRITVRSYLHRTVMRAGGGHPSARHATTLV